MFLQQLHLSDQPINITCRSPRRRNVRIASAQSTTLIVLSSRARPRGKCHSHSLEQRVTYACKHYACKHDACKHAGTVSNVTSPAPNGNSLLVRFPTYPTTLPLLHRTDYLTYTQCYSPCSTPTKSAPIAPHPHIFQPS